MENPASVLVLPAQFTKLTFRNLYIRRAGPGSREITEEGRCDLDKRYVSDFPVYDGRGPDASLVARVQGITSEIGNAHQLFVVVFDTDRYTARTDCLLACMCLWRRVLANCFSSCSFRPAYASLCLPGSRAPRSSPMA
jgi:hypothetical protein